MGIWSKGPVINLVHSSERPFLALVEKYTTQDTNKSRLPPPSSLMILSSSYVLASWCRRGGKEEQEEGRLNLQHLLLALAWALQIKLSCFFLGAHEYLFVLVAAHASSAPKRGRAATVSREGGTGTQRNPPSIEVCRGQSEEV